MTSFKRTQRKYVQKGYRVRNWREYETGLRAVLPSSSVGEVNLSSNYQDTYSRF